MVPKPDFEPRFAGSGRLEGKTALITGGDSGIGRAVSVLFAREGAEIAIVYLEEDEDAKETEALVEEEGSECLLIKGDVGSAKFCDDAVKRTLKRIRSARRAGQQRRRTARAGGCRATSTKIS